MNYLAVDLRASGGKIILGKIQEDNLGIKEVHRFANRPILEGQRYVWDINYLYEEIVRGLKKANKLVNDIVSIGIDSWGLDFGLIGTGGNIIKNPYSYRDKQISSTKEQVLKNIPKQEVFAITGISHWNLANTLWQYHYLSQNEPEQLHKTKRILMISQLFSFMLGGDMCAEETLASTTQMMDVKSRTWSDEIGNKLGLSLDKFPRIKGPRTKIGTLKSKIANATGVKADIVLPPSHDTAAAVAGMPLRKKNKAFLSTGTWFIAGLELRAPCLTKKAYEIGASNEAGVEGTTRFLKNVTGFFILEECRKKWRENDQIHDYGALLEEVSKTKPFGPLIDPDDESFTITGDMTEKIASYCRETSQEVPKTEGEIARCIFESLAVKTAMTLEDLMEVSNVSSETLHLGGGGTKNELFCQMISSATQVPVYAGPAEAAAVGNILTQAKAYSEIGSIGEGRRLVRGSLKIRKYEPEEHEKWEEAKDKMKRIIKRRNSKKG